MQQRHVSRSTTMATDPLTLTLPGKLLSVTIAIVGFTAAFLLAFFLGLQLIPLDAKDPHKDLVRRLLGCAVSSLIVGLPVLIYLHYSFAWVFTSASAISELNGLGKDIGPQLVTWCVFLVAALPGWWFVGMLVRQAAGFEGKTLAQAKDDIKAML